MEILDQKETFYISITKRGSKSKGVTVKAESAIAIMQQIEDILRDQISSGNISPIPKGRRANLVIRQKKNGKYINHVSVGIFNLSPAELKKLILG